MQGTLFINGEEIGVMNEMPKIKAAVIIGVDYAKGKDITVLSGKGTLTLKDGADWEKVDRFITIKREKHLKNIAAFREAWNERASRIQTDGGMSEKGERKWR